MKLIFILLVIVVPLAGCSPRTSAIKSCSFDVQKLLLQWLRPDGNAIDIEAYNLRKTELLWGCMEAKGWIFNTPRSNAEYFAGRSPGLVGMAEDPKNWYWGWFGLLHASSD
jgi:hypothetical protein